MIRTIHFIFLLFLIRGSLSVHKICKRGLYGNPTCERIFIWNSNETDFISLFGGHLHFTNDESALRGQTIQVAVAKLMPYVSIDRDTQKLKGFLGDIWLLIEEALKFKTDLSRVYYDHGLDLITTGKTDIMLAAGVVKQELLNVEYSQPYFYNWYDLYTKMPKARASSLSYLRTFSYNLWLCSFLAFAILTVLLWFEVKFLNSTYRLESRVSLPSCFLAVISGLINQGFDLKLSNYSCRMLIITALSLGIVLYSAITAVLVAQLAVFDTPFPFTSLADIEGKRTHSLCLRSESFVYNNFTNEKKEVLDEWRDVLNTPPCLDINDQKNLSEVLCRDNVVILENHIVLETVLKNNNIPCEVLSLNSKYFVRGNSFFLSKSFKYLRIIDRMVKKLKDVGIVRRLEEKWIHRTKLVNLNLPQTPQVTLDHVNGILVMYVIMVLISLVILLVEKCIHGLSTVPHYKKPTV